MVSEYKKFVKECIMAWDGKPKDFAILYTLAGLVEETYELTEVLENPDDKYRKKIISEAGDILWYITVYYEINNQALPELESIRAKPHSGIFKEVLEIQIRGCNSVFHENENIFPNKELETILSKLKFVVHNMCRSTMKKVMDENIKKLNGRYPNGRETKHVDKDVNEELIKMGVDD